MENSIEICPVCGVSIEAGSIVRYSFGEQKTLDHLSKKVCQYNKDKRGNIKKAGCINSKFNKDADYGSFIESIPT